MPRKFSQIFWLIVLLAVLAFLAIEGVSLKTIEAAGGASALLLGIWAACMDRSPFRRKK